MSMMFSDMYYSYLYLSSTRKLYTIFSIIFTMYLKPYTSLRKEQQKFQSKKALSYWSQVKQEGISNIDSRVKGWGDSFNLMYSIPKGRGPSAGGRGFHLIYSIPKGDISTGGRGIPTRSSSSWMEYLLLLADIIDIPIAFLLTLRLLLLLIGTARSQSNKFYCYE